MPMPTKELQREYCRVWVAKRREKFFSDKSCKWCGGKEELEIHHTDPKTKVSNSIWSWSEKRRNEEIAKCIVLCKKCHHKFHDEQARTWVHGIASTYKKGCRCNPCRQAQYKTMKRKTMRVEGLAS